MATSNKIVYTFIAIDKFTQTADKIRKTLNKFDNKIKTTQKKMDNSLSKPLNKAKKNLEKTKKVLKNAVDDFNKAPQPVSRLGNFFSRFSKKVSNAGKHLSSFSHIFNKWSDKFGMEAYFKYMNIIIPMGVLTHLGLKYAQSLHSAQISMSSLFGNVKGYAHYQKMIATDAAKWSAKSPFSRAEYYEAIAGIARKTGNIEIATKFVPQAIGYAAAMGKFKKGQLPMVATQLMSQILSGQIGELPISTAQQEQLRHIVKGPAYERMRRALEWFEKNPDIFKKALGAQLKTSSVQLAIFNNKLADLAHVITDALEPVFKNMADFMQSIVPPIKNFIKHHKFLVLILGKVAVGASIVLVSLMALGAIFGVIGALLGGIEFAALSVAVITLTLAFKSLYHLLINFLNSSVFHPFRNETFSSPKEMLSVIKGTGLMPKNNITLHNHIHVENKMKDGMSNKNIQHSTHYLSWHGFTSSVKHMGSEAYNFVTGRNSGSYDHL